MLQRASTVLIIAFLAIASEGVLCALPCSAALTNLTGDAGAPTGHCETNPVQPLADLTLAPAPGFCGGEHAGITSPSERASTRVAFLGAATLRTASVADHRRGNIPGSNLRTEVHGSPPILTPPLRI